MNKKHLGIVFITLLLFMFTVLSGCSSDPVSNKEEEYRYEQEKENKRETEETSNENTEKQQPEKKEIVDGTICPLCGRLVEKKDLYIRPIAVMIENHPHARPQSGLDEADIVYEMPVEGGISRFMAVYLHSDRDKIGPVRSSRHYYLDKLLEYDGIYVYFGGSPRAWEDISKLKIQGMNGIYDGVTFWRDKTRKMPHNAYTSMERIKKTSKSKGYNREVDFKHFQFHKEDVSLEGEKAENVKITFSPFDYTVEYTFNEETGEYLRYMDGNFHVDRETKQQLRTKNIIIQQAKTWVIPGDDQGRLDMKLVGKGEGYYITQGNCIKVTWEKKTRKGYTYFYDENQKRITLNPGNTWIEVIPYKADIQIK